MRGQGQGQGEGKGESGGCCLKKVCWARERVRVKVQGSGFVPGRTEHRGLFRWTFNRSRGRTAARSVRSKKKKGGG